MQLYIVAKQCKTSWVNERMYVIQIKWMNIFIYYGGVYVSCYDEGKQNSMQLHPDTMIIEIDALPF